ncbi:MAG TPA: ester cyclase [Chthonomonadaceae bacterium]|nr:ester cyclase [Chthonomonadaceae bacterium]
MSIKHNLHVMRRWLKSGWSEGDLDVADEIISPDFLVHGAGGQVIPAGNQGVKDLVHTWRVAFPDGVMSVLDDIPEGDKVGVRLVWRGTHLGDFYGVPASGNKVEVTSIGIDKVGPDGKISEGWGEVDMLGMMQQIGAIPKMGPSAPADPGSLAESPARPTSTSPEENKKVVLGFVEAINHWDLEGAKALCAIPGYVEHNPAWGAIGFDGTVQTYTMIRASLPDLTFTPDMENVLAAADKVVVRGTVSGTHTGAPLFGVPPSGKKVEWTGIDISRVTDGKITERWLCADILRLMTELGLVPGQG